LRAKATKEAEPAERFLALLGDAESVRVLQDAGFDPPGAVANR
jgi:hypothetical protein